MSQILKLTHENQQLKRQINQYQQVLGVSPYVNDSLFKGGYRVVKTITDRDKIDCCHRKLGMKVLVVGNDLSFKEYILKTNNCKENIWEEVDVTVEENDVTLIEDYSELGENLTTQRDLNLVLKQILQNIQTQIDNIELTDEKVQITENTDFAQVGENQKIFNKNVSIYKNNNDLKNQEQDNRLTDIESENIVQYDLINDLQTALDSKLNKGSYPGNASDLKTEIDGKLNKPTTTSNTTSYPYVVGEDGNGNPARLPAGDLGKNFFNSDLSNTTARNHTMNAGITVNTLGNPYSLTGLPNKNTDATNFDSVVRYNPITGQLAYGQAFIYNVPSTITINHVNAPTSPDIPSYIQAIQDRITQLSQPGVVMQRFTNWTVKTLNDTVTTTNVENNTNIYTATSVFNTNSGIITNTEVVSVHTNKILPKNADWVILFNIKIASDGAGNNTAPKTNRLMGIHNSETGTLIIPSLYLFDSNYGYSTHNLAILKNGGGSKLITSNGGTNTADIIFSAVANSIIPAMILKVGDNILVQAQYGSTTISEIYSAQSLSGDNFGFCVTARKSFVGLEAIGNISNVRYYIFP